MEDRIKALPEGYNWLMRSMDGEEHSTQLRNKFLDEGARVFCHLMLHDNRRELVQSYRGFGVDMESAWDDALAQLNKGRN